MSVTIGIERGVFCRIRSRVNTSQIIPIFFGHESSGTAFNATSVPPIVVAGVLCYFGYTIPFGFNRSRCYRAVIMQKRGYPAVLH